MVAEARRLDPSVEALGGWLGALPQPLTIALEATLYWHWLERQLTALGHRVVVASLPGQADLAGPRQDRPQ